MKRLLFPPTVIFVQEVIMLLKFTAPDMLNTSLIDVATGERAYNIVTVLSPPVEKVAESPELPAQASSSSHSV